MYVYIHMYMDIFMKTPCTFKGMYECSCCSDQRYSSDTL